MNDLLKVNYDTDQPTVSARELHEKLNIGTKFTTWFERMKDYGFSEGNEFFPKLGETSEQGGRPQTDFQISVDMAKQICMIQRSPEGKMIRQYFIDLEKAWNTPEQIMARALKMANQSIDSLKERCAFLGGQVVEQQKVISELQPKANYVDTILQSKSLVLTTQIAKDYGMSARKFNRILNELKIQYKVGDQWVLYSKYQSNGYVHSRTINITRSNGMPDTKMQTEWTQKGRLFLYDELKKAGYVPLIEKAA
ncbi:phage antirepressor KilAC domain-containing protein [Eubacterium ramulus]|uniref:phage antirepressor KilAC domain-containing protein n=1 Tax=Eubacterium ramulus TaxID=39490 RepID=UPI0022DE9A22|nr:phage antirepressor KilAC domain-containing protein [Eubacterium ramulus]